MNRIKVTKEEYSAIRHKHEMDFIENTENFSSLAKIKLTESDLEIILLFLQNKDHKSAFLHWHGLAISLTSEEENIVDRWYSFFSK